MTTTQPPSSAKDHMEASLSRTRDALVYFKERALTLPIDYCLTSKRGKNAGRLDLHSRGDWSAPPFPRIRGKLHLNFENIQTLKRIRPYQTAQRSEDA